MRFVGLMVLIGLPVFTVSGDEVREVETIEKLNVPKSAEKMDLKSELTSEGNRYRFYLGAKLALTPNYNQRNPFYDENDPQSTITSSGREGGPGFGIGYRYLEDGSFGYSIELGTVQYIVDYTDYSFMRLEANGNYTFGQRFYVFGGLNLSRQMSGEVFSERDRLPTYGYQIGSGLVFSERFGLNIRYYEMREKISESSDFGEFTYNESISGFEFSLDLFII
jgi:hypothetical protein